MLKNNAAVFKRKHKSSNYKVEYHLFRERNRSLGGLTIPDDVKKKKGLVTLKNVCFSGLMGAFKADKKKLNRLCYKPRVNKVIKSKDVKHWIEIAKAGRLLPPYVEFEHLKKTFLLRCNIAPSLLYVYLCTLRDVEEEPDFVRITSHFVDEGMDIHAAIVAASSICINNSGHHYLSLNAAYSERPVSSIRVSLAHIFQLKKFLMNPSRYDKRSCVLLKNLTAFSAQNTIGRIESAGAGEIPIADLFDKYIADMLSSGKYSKKLYNKYATSKVKKA